MTTKAVAYIRVSSEEQKNVGYSMPHQDKRIREFAAANGLDIVAWFRESRSAKPNAKRPEWDRLVACAREHRDVRVVLTHKNDRAMRNYRDFSEVTEVLGLRLMSVEENVPDTPLGRLTQSFGIGVARYYVENLSQEVKKGLNQKFEEGGVVTKAPVGYLNVPRGASGGKRRSSVIIDPKKGPVVARAFEAYATGNYSLLDISLDMAKDGVATANGKSILPENIARMFRHPMYIGMVRYRGEVRPGVHPPLVSVACFDRVQETLKNRRGNQSPNHKPFLLRGLLTCHPCGGAMTAEDQKRGSYYHCKTRPGSPKCAARWSPVGTLELEAASLLLRDQLSIERTRELLRAADSVSGHTVQERADRMADIGRRLEELDTELTRLVAAFTAGHVPEGAYLKVKDDLVLEQARLKEERDAPVVDIEKVRARVKRVLRQASNLAERVAAAKTIDDKKAVLAEVIDRITVRDRHIESIEYRAPFHLLFGSAAQSASNESIVRELLRVFERR